MLCTSKETVWIKKYGSRFIKRSKIAKSYR